MCHGTRITDAGIAHLSSIPLLQYLDISDTRVTDKSLSHLKELPNLQTLILYQTEVTPAGIEEFKKLRPDVEIGWNKTTKD